jgi:hypothetical protein
MHGPKLASDSIRIAHHNAAHVLRDATLGQDRPRLEQLPLQLGCNHLDSSVPCPFPDTPVALNAQFDDGMLGVRRDRLDVEVVCRVPCGLLQLAAQIGDDLWQNLPMVLLVYATINTHDD